MLPSLLGQNKKQVQPEPDVQFLVSGSVLCCSKLFCCDYWHFRGWWQISCRCPVAGFWLSMHRRRARERYRYHRFQVRTMCIMACVSCWVGDMISRWCLDLLVCNLVCLSCQIVEQRYRATAGKSIRLDMDMSLEFILSWLFPIYKTYVLSDLLTISVNHQPSEHVF